MMKEKFHLINDELNRCKYIKYKQIFGHDNRSTIVGYKLM